MSGFPVGLLLAAGSSRRFGSNKLLYPVRNGTPMLLLAAQQLVSVLPDSIIVINQQLLPYREPLQQLGLQVVVNEQAQQGMGSSIACGVRASEAATGWLITLADMPYLKTQTIQRLVARLSRGAAIVAPVIGQQRGHPVGFCQDYKAALLALHDDIGARQIIADHQQQLELVVTDDPGIIRDVDHVSDLVVSGTA